VFSSGGERGERVDSPKRGLHPSSKGSETLYPESTSIPEQGEGIAARTGGGEKDMHIIFDKK